MSHTCERRLQTFWRTIGEPVGGPVGEPVDETLEIKERALIGRKINNESYLWAAASFFLRENQSNLDQRVERIILFFSFLEKAKKASQLH